jgi:hypothetical protein
MKHATVIGRIAGLAVGLGIGAALAAMPGTASAVPDVPPFDPNDLAISVDGFTLFQTGTATATSGIGDIAIADGAGTEAIASGGIFPFDFALAYGHALADAAGGSFDSATAVGNGVDAFAIGFADLASVSGDNAEAKAVDGIGDVATVDNTGSAFDQAISGGTSFPDLGYFDIASVIGTGSTADSGINIMTNALGNFDLAAAFGDMLHAVATGGNFLTDILP